jgi:hypothetical protein
MNRCAGVVVAIAILALPVTASARLMQCISLHSMRATSDLIVVARPVTSTTETSERTRFDSIDAPAVGAETSFAVVQVLKGDPHTRDFVLHHYQEPDPEPSIGGPGVVSFDASGPSRTNVFLLFLVKEADGRFAPFGGQTDPERRSVFSLVQPPAEVACDGTVPCHETLPWKFLKCGGAGERIQCRFTRNDALCL